MSYVAICKDSGTGTGMQVHIVQSDCNAFWVINQSIDDKLQAEQ